MSPTTAVSTASSSTGQIIDRPRFEVTALLLGNRGAGKATLLRRLNEECQSEHFTIGRVAVELPNHMRLSNFTPTHTQRDGRMAMRMNFPESHGVLLVYDVSNRQSYEALTQWYKKIEHQVHKYSFKIVVGNKADVREDLRQVETNEGRQFSSKIGWAFFEVSATKALHTKEIMSRIASRMFDGNNHLRDAPSPVRNSLFNRITTRLKNGRRCEVVSELAPNIECDVLSLDDFESSSHVSTDESIRSNFEDIEIEAVSIAEQSNMQPVEGNDYEVLESMIKQIHDRLSILMSDEEQKQIVLSQKGPSAQLLLDLFHMLLDHPDTSSTLRPSLMVATKHLCYRSSLYPRSFVLRDICWEKQTLYAGGFGDILKGRFQDQEVCLKVVKVYANYDNDRLIRAFSKEAILWSHVSHPNTLPFYGIFKDPYFEGRICLVSPWMAHGNINEFIRNNPDADRHRLINDTAEGIKYLHQNNIIHGDLKGCNILINDDGRACIGDFGLSTIVNVLGSSGQWTTAATSVFGGGTLRWQAPELMSHDIPHVTMMSDVYAFACVCYEVLTGKIPFYNILREAPIILNVVTRGQRPSRPDDGSIPDCTWEMMESCWREDPSKRPQMLYIVERLRGCPFVEKRNDENWGTLSSSSIRVAMHGPMKHMTARELSEILNWL